MTNKIIGPKADPELADIILKIKNDISYNLYCVQIGTIELYDPIKNTANISINFKRKLPDGSTLDYPLLAECPVFILSGGDTCVTMPIKKGDNCIILFNDRNIDTWFYSGEVKEPDSPRAHSISDAIALVGIRNLKTAKPTSQTTIMIDSGTQKIAMKNMAANFKILIDTLITTLTTATVQGPGVYPFTATTIAALNSIKTQFALLFDEGLT